MAALSFGSAQAQDPIQIAGYYADFTAKEYLEKDLVHKNFESVLIDNDGADAGTCAALLKGKNFWENNNSNKGAYLRSIPTYTGTESDEWGEYTSYYGSSDFHITWVNQAFRQGLNPTFNAGLSPLGSGNGKANFFAGYINKQANPNTQGVWYTGNKNCVGFHESIKKATTYVYQFGEIMQLLQAAYDSVKTGCLGSEVNPNLVCFDAVQKWDAAVGIFVGSLEGNGADDNDVRPTGVTFWSQAGKRCANFNKCGIYLDSNSNSDTSPVNFKIMRLFAAGRQATFQGQKDQMKILQRLISNKLVVGGIQGVMRYAWRLSGQDGPRNQSALTPGVDAPGFGASTAPDQDVGAMSTFAMHVLPKVWACSRNAETLLYTEVAVGGPKTVTFDATDNGMRPSVNFDNVKLALECNYRCLGITCEEVGSLFDQQTSNGYGEGATGTPLARSVACNDGKMGTSSPNVGCKRQRGAEKKACKPYVKRPGISGRDKLEFYTNAIGINR